MITEALAPAEASWLLDFARICRAAARAVALYPAEHPSIGVSLDRLTRVCQAFPSEDPVRMWIFPDGLRLNQRRLPQADTAASELAQMLHERRVGEIAILRGVAADNWRTFLTVLARSPEDLAAHGGFTRVWVTSGGQSIEVKEIDYAELLKERPSGQDASWDAVFQQFLAGGLHFDDSALKVVLDASGHPEKLVELIEAIQTRVADKIGPKALGAALARMLDGAMKLAPDSEQLETIVRGMASAIARLPAETLLSILTADRQGDASMSPDLRRELVSHMPDSAIAEFVSRTVVEQGGASARLAQAFQVLVPDLERQRALLALARKGAESSFDNSAQFDHLWRRVEDLLINYSDTRYVSTEYGEELTRAQQRPAGLDAAVDSPDRIAAWLGSVADDEVRKLDHQLVTDLLTIEHDAARFSELMPIATSHATALARSGSLEAAVRTVQMLVAEAGKEESARRRTAAAALETLSHGEFIPSIASHIQQADDTLFPEIKQLFRAMGSPVIRPLAEALAKEQRNPVRLRLRDALLGFGAVGRHSVEQLKKSPDPDVRRTAIHLMREFGGHEALPDLASLLDDREPHVQREATRAILFIGTPEAYETLGQALRTGTDAVRETIMGVMVGSRDEAAVPLLAYIVNDVGPGGTLREVYQRSLEALGEFGGDVAIEALKKALYRGEWWAPIRTRVLRATAAKSLSRIGTPAAHDVLREAVSRGLRGVRAAARPYVKRK